MNPGEASLLRLYINADDTHHGKRLYEAVVLKARELGLAGASVFTAEIGYGCHHVVHDVMSEYSFMGAPIVVEVVEVPEQIEKLLGAFTAMVGEGFVTVSTVSPVRVTHYTHRSE